MSEVQVFEGDGKMPPEWVAIKKENIDLIETNATLRMVIEKNAMMEKSLKDQNDELRKENEGLIRRLARIHAALNDGDAIHLPKPMDKGDEGRFFPISTSPIAYKIEPQQQMESLKNSDVKEKKQKDLMARLLEMSQKPVKNAADDEEPSLW